MAELMKYIGFTVIAILTLSCASAFAVEDAAVNNDALTEINKAMRQTATFSARFKQIKKFRILTSAIELDGHLYINRAPFRLAWRIEKPMLYTVIMNDDRLLQWDEETARTREYKFNDNPVLKVVSQTYHDILLGDFSQIARDCDITVVKSTYTIKVVPKAGSNMGKAVAAITFRFNENFHHLVRIDVIESGGNTTVTDFSDIKINEPIAENAWKTGNDR